jgi:hypothetical protein
MGTGKEVHRETQERRYEGESTSQKDNENGKSEDAILERIAGLRKKEQEERSWENTEKLLPKE